MPNIDRDFSKSTVSYAACWIGLAIVAMGLLVPHLLVPYHLPYSELLLVPPVLVAAVVGSIGGLYRAWWLTGLIWASLVLVLAIVYGINHYLLLWKALLYPDVVGQPPMMNQLYHITLVPLTLGVAVLIHGWIAGRGRWREEAKALASLRVGLVVGALLGGVGGAAFEALTAVREGSRLDEGDMLVFATFGMPVGAVFGSLTGVIVGILRRRHKTRAALPQPADLTKYHLKGGKLHE
jgi:hypothetical protein